MPLTLEEIKAKVGPLTKLVYIEAFGGDVLIKKLGAADYIALQEDTPKSGDKEATFRYFIRICQRCAVNPDGSPLFGDDDSVLVSMPLEASQLGQEIAAFNHLLRGNDSEKKSDGQQQESSGTASV